MAKLTQGTLKVARSVCVALFDSGAGIPAERLDWVAADLASYASLAGYRCCIGLNLAFFAVQMLPLLVIGRFSRFTTLARDKQQRYLEKIERSSVLTLLVTVTKLVLALIYFEHPDVFKEAGVRADCAVEHGDDTPGWKRFAEGRP